MDGLPSLAAICATRKTFAGLRPIVVIATTIILIAATISYTEGSRGADVTIKSSPAAPTHWRGQAAATVTAAIVDRRHPDRSSPQVGPTGFFYAAD